MNVKPTAFALAAAACAAMVLPTTASAQTYGYDYPSAYSNNTYYDPCARDQRERQAGAGLLGAAIGAVAGSQVASRGRRTEGSLLGGVLGAAVGAGVGRGTAACQSTYQRSAHYQGYETPSYGGYGAGYDPYDRRDYRRDDGYDYYRDYPQSYDRGYGGYGGSIQPVPADDGCRLAESQIRMPDGRMEVRHVRTCPDSSGRYRIVD